MSCAVLMTVRGVLTRQAVKIYQTVTGDNIEWKKGISKDGSEKSNGEGGELVS